VAARMQALSESGGATIAEPEPTPALATPA
jgi:hypothetical protein